MRLICAFSSLEFNVQHFPGTLSNRETVHPIFYIPQKKLLSYSVKWAAGELTTTDSYLLFLALLNSTDNIEFRLQAIRTNHTDSIVASNMENLFNIVGKLNIVQHPGFTPPQFVISPETRNLANVANWIAIWENYYNEWYSGYRTMSEEQKLIRRTAALERMINSAHVRNEKAFARILADWAEIAGNFPKSPTLVNTAYIPLNEYWKQIIIKCFNAEQIFTIPKTDIDELLCHCEDNITQGSSYAYNLLKALRSGLAKQTDFLGFGELDLNSSTRYRIIDAESSVETANKLALIEAAPTTLPKELDYPSKIAYLRAKVKWDMAQEYYKLNPPAAVIQSSEGEL